MNFVAIQRLQAQINTLERVERREFRITNPTATAGRLLRVVSELEEVCAFLANQQRYVEVGTIETCTPRSGGRTE